MPDVVQLGVAKTSADICEALANTMKGYIAAKLGVETHTGVLREP